MNNFKIIFVQSILYGDQNSSITESTASNFT